MKVESIDGVIIGISGGKIISFEHQNHHGHDTEDHNAYHGDVWNVTRNNDRLFVCNILYVILLYAFLINARRRR